MIFFSHNNDGWPWFLYCTYQCSFIKLRFNWVRRSKMAWLIGLVEVGWHPKYYRSLPSGVLSSSRLNWLLHMTILGQSYKRVEMEAAWLSLTVVHRHCFHLLLFKASYKKSLIPEVEEEHSSPAESFGKGTRMEHRCRRLWFILPLWPRNWFISSKAYFYTAPYHSVSGNIYCSGSCTKREED